LSVETPSGPQPRTGIWRRLLRHPGVLIGAAVILVMVLVGLLAPFLGTMSPSEINPIFRNRLPGMVRTIRLDGGGQATFTHWMGTDSLGRDIYSRVVYGARISILVGATVALISVTVGLVIGLVAGYVRWVDSIVMRLMDGLMRSPDPARHRPRVAVPRRPFERRRGDRRAGGAARRAPGSLDCALGARGALCGSGHHGRHADAAPAPAPCLA
jgi:hypothetical protein